MSNGIVLLVVAIILIVVIAYLFGVVIRKRNDAQIASLEEKKQELFDLPVNEEIEKVKNLHLIGQSQTSFREWNQKWVDLSLNSFSDIENHIFEAEGYNDTFNFIKAQHEIKSIQSQLTVVEEDIKAIREALAALAEQEEKNTSQVTYALDLYEKLQNTIASDTDQYGTGMPEITKQLNNIQTEFSQFVTLNSSGDPVEAAEILEKAEEHTIALSQITEQIPEIVAKIDSHFPEQLDDLSSGYTRLLEENYHFTETDIESGFQEIREAVSEISDDIARLDVEKAKVGCEDVQAKIEHYYDLFEHEIAAHKEVVKLVQRLPKYLEHVKANNAKLLEELNRLSQRYIFSDHIGNKLGIYSDHLSTMESTLVPSLDAMTEHEKPFSEWQKELEKHESKLSEIEDGQFKLLDELQQTERGEADAQETLDTSINRLHAIKRFMEKRNLPGIPQEFMTQFFKASSQLEILRDELNRSRLDMATISKMVEVTTTVVEELEASTYQVVRDAVLTEQLLQYSNRYRSFDQDVQNAYDSAMRKFQVEYQYAAAFDEISYALDIVEPGVTDRFVKSYEKSKEMIKF